jgi:hypothetical protein
MNIMNRRKGNKGMRKFNNKRKQHHPIIDLFKVKRRVSGRLSLKHLELY